MKKAKAHSDPFRMFKTATSKAFTFLLDRGLGFRQTETVTTPPEIVIRYTNDTTRVDIAYEWGGAPSVIVCQLDQDKPNVIKAKIGLRFLVMERCPELLHLFEDSSLKRPLHDVLVDYAEALHQVGEDVLSGDFSILPKLKPLIKKEQLRANLMTFGSESGETIKQ